MADIFREIDEDVRRDRIIAFWQRHSGAILGLVGLIVIGTAAAVTYQNWRQGQYESAGIAYSRAMNAARAGDSSTAIRDFETIAAQNGAGYGLISRLQAAVEKAKGVDRAGGLAALDAITADSSVGEDYRNIARLLWGVYAVDGQPPATVIEKLKPLAGSSTPWRFTATELTALAKLRSGDKAGALGDYRGLADDLSAPQSLRARAAEIVNDLKS